LQAGCTTTAACADATCSAAIKLVLMVHDVCPEDKLPNNLEAALHDHEEPCEDQLCNSAAEAFDPYAEPCKPPLAALPLPDAEPSAAPTADAAYEFGSQAAFLVTMLALSLALISP